MRVVRTIFLPAIVAAIAAIVVGVPAAAGSSQGTAGPKANQPKNLQAKITIVMGDTATGMYYGIAKGKPRASFSVPAGKTVGIKVVNRGTMEHELLFGRKFIDDADDPRFRQNIFESLPADVFVFKPAKMEIGGATFGEIEAEPGGELWIRTVFPPKMKGTWEISCMLPGHREAGMVASFTIR